MRDHDVESHREFIETTVGFHDHLRQMAGNYILALVGSALAHLFSDRAIGAHPSEWSDQERTVFADEFSGSTLDRARWNVIVTGRTVNNEQQAYIDSPDVLRVRGGHLEIQPRFRREFKTPEGRSFDFISGRIDTRSKVSFTYGTAAARIRLTAGDGLWPAFWALGDGGWPDTGEIDIMENVGDRTWTSAALHGPGYFGDTPLVKRAGVDITKWHVYAVDVGRDQLHARIAGDTRVTSLEGTDARALTRALVPDPVDLLV